MAPLDGSGTYDAAVAIWVVIASGAVRLGHRGARRATYRRPAVQNAASSPEAPNPAADDQFATAIVGLGALAATLAWLTSRSVLWTVSAPAVGAACGYGLIVGARRRRRAQIERALPGVVEEMARSLRSGASFHQALRDVAATTPGPIGVDLASIVRRVALGVGLDHALATWADARDVPSARLFYGAMALTMRSGPDSGRALDGLAQSMRDKAVVEQETKALVAQAQLSGLVIAALPVAFLAFSLLIDRGSASFLLGTPLGRGCLVGALGLDAVGYGWMRRLAHSVQA